MLEPDASLVNARGRAWRDRADVPIDIALLSLLAMCSFYYSGLGFIGSDDAGYIEAARKWVHAIPAVSHFFGDLRYPIVLPIAASIMLFGDGEFTVALPTLLYAWGIIVLTYVGVRSLMDRPTALIAAALMSISPLLAGWSTTASDDVCELFFVALSIFTFLHATRHGSGWPLFALSGVAAGLALMTRESSISLLALYGTLFILDFGGCRRMYWVLAVGFASVFAVEVLWYTVALGDPLYRFRLVATALGKPDPIHAVGSVDLSTERVYNISPLLDPIFYIVSHPQFALLFVVVLIAIATIAARQVSLPPYSRLMFFCWCALCGLSFLVSAYVLSHLALQARYFMTPLFCAAVAISIWLFHGLWPQYRRLGMVAAAALVIAAVFGQMIPNKSPIFAERVLTSLAASKGMIHTDPETEFRGRLLLHWANVADRVSTTRPQSGDLFLYNPKFAQLLTPRNAGLDLAVFQPRAGWSPQGTFAAPHTILGRMVVALGLANCLPAPILRRVEDPNPPVTLFRVGPDGK